MSFFRWVWRLIKAAAFGALCGAGGFLGGTLVFGILQLFLGWSKRSTDTIIWICAGLAAIWAVVTIIRNGIEDDANKSVLDTYAKAYENATGEKYTYIPPLESIGKEPPAKISSGGYSHTDIYGRSIGYTKVEGNSADHYSVNGYSTSFQNGNDVFHYGVDGYHGRSYVSDDGKTVTHYGKDNMPSGYSKMNADGSVDHFDKWGMYTGTSQQE